MASETPSIFHWGHKFRLQLILRCSFLVLVIFAFVYTILDGRWPVSSLFLGLAIVILVVNLIRYLESANREFRHFLEAIAHHDFTYSFPESKRDKTLGDLKAISEVILESFRALRAEKESHYQYLQNVVEHVQVALLCYQEGEELALMNQAARKLLQRPYLSHLHQLEHSHPELLDAMRTIGHGERVLIRTRHHQLSPHIALQATEFKLQDTAFKLVSLQDIRVELEEKEVESWQKLIRVLTHEIMNSVTPIVSLSKVTHSLLMDESGALKPTLAGEDLADIQDSILTIENRSKGLLHFVHAYRSLSRIPPPQTAPILAQELLNRTYTLLKPELDRRGIAVEVQVPEKGLTLTVDPDLIEQVLINLVKNAMEALENQPDKQIKWGSRTQKEGRIQIWVQDNGPGIDPEIADKIFIPFFTTKAKGSGIGLSLSRQIMRLHQGNIELESAEGAGTNFYLTFPPFKPVATRKQV